MYRSLTSAVHRHVRGQRRRRRQPSPLFSLYLQNFALEKLWVWFGSTARSWRVAGWVEKLRSSQTFCSLLILYEFLLALFKFIAYFRMKETSPAFLLRKKIFTQSFFCRFKSKMLFFTFYRNFFLCLETVVSYFVFLFYYFVKKKITSLIHFLLIFISFPFSSHLCLSFLIVLSFFLCYYYN